MSSDWGAKMNRLKKLMIGLGIFFLIFTMVGFFVLPPVLKSILVKKLSETLHREVGIQQLKINPYSLSLTLKGFVIKDRVSSETFFSFDELYVNLQSLSALRMALILKEIRLKQPYIRVSRNEDASYNFSDLLEKKEPETAEKPAKKPKPLRFSLNNIRIENGSIDFSDGPKKTKHTIRELNIGIPFLSNIPSNIDIFVQPILSAKINETPYRLEGSTKPFADSLETTFNININDLNIPYYLGYAPMKMNFKIVSAYMDTQVKIIFVQAKDQKPSLTLAGNVSLKKIAVDDQQNKPLLRLPLLDLSIAPSEPITKIIHLSKVSIQSPELEIRRDGKGDLNVASLLTGKNEAKQTPQEIEASPPFSLEIDEIQLLGGKLSFSDLSRSKPFKTILDPIGLKIDHFSNGKDKKSAYALSLKTEAKENVKLEGNFSMDPLGAEGTLEIKSVPLNKYAPYYRENVLFDIEEGRLDLSTRYKYSKGEKEPEISLSRITLSLSALRLKKEEENQEFLNIPDFSIKETEMNLTKKELKIGGVSTQKGEILIKRLSNGDMNVLKLFPPSSPSKAPSEEDETKEPQKPWLVSLKQLAVDNYAIHIEDQTLSEPAPIAVENLTLRGEDISTAKNKKGRFSLSLLLNKKGTVSTSGTIGIDPMTADLKMDLKGVEIGTLQSYFTDKIKITVTSGAFSTTGNLTLGTTDKKELKATYSGQASLTHFASMDKVNAEDVLKMESLAFNDIHFDSNPFSVDIKGIALSNFYAHVLIHPDGKLNLQKIFGSEETKNEASSEKKTPPPERKQDEASKEKEPPRNIKIGTLTLQEGRIDFSDKSINPEFSAKLSEIGGRISGLSSEETSLGEMELRAKLNDDAPLEIIGKINPLKQDLYVDLKIGFKGMDLSPVTPYSGKYAGYSIQKGKLSFDLKYLIDKRSLDARNVIFLDQFTFGDRIESPQATKLPVKLAIALLKDRKGEIKLDIPVSGNLDDPKFSVWGIILKIIVNLIAKAATSPFALLGAIFGGGEELSYLEFDYGMATIAETNTKKIDTLVKALSDRPVLKMDIEGHVDLERDREGLKQLLFQRKLKAQKLKEMVKKGIPAVPIDEVKIEKPEYEKYLKMAYKEEKFSKPRNILGIAKDLPVSETEKLIFTHIEIKESDLRVLASQRAASVKEAILKTGKVESERIFILEPKSLLPEKNEKLKDSRVDFKLK